MVTFTGWPLWLWVDMNTIREIKKPTKRIVLWLIDLEYYILCISAPNLCLIILNIGFKLEINVSSSSRTAMITYIHRLKLSLNTGFKLELWIWVEFELNSIISAPKQAELEHAQLDSTLLSLIAALKQITILGGLLLGNLVDYNLQMSVNKAINWWL